MSAELTRRGVLAGSVAGVASVASGLASRAAFARGRIASGGKLALRIPWSVAEIDPHRIDDPVAALLGEALFDTLYARDDAGAFAPALAESEPEPEGANLRVTLRAGLRTAAGRAIDARDVVFSLARARQRGARGWLSPVPPPRADGRGALVFSGKDAAKLVQSLATPLAAIVPTTFVPTAPDGTGPFRAERRAGGLALVRNGSAARGPAFLEEIMIRAAPDLSASLRAFESGADDLGWLGSGLHEPRPGSKVFDGGAVAWAVLRTGREAGAWGAPGVAQRLADGVSPSRLSYLALGPAWAVDAEQGWGGAPCELVVRDDAPWLVELARAVAATIARPAHEVTVRTVPAAELERRRATRTFALAIDVVRPLAPSPIGALVALATADDPAASEDVAKYPPRLADGVSARTLTRTRRLGILGEIRVQGGRVPDLVLPASPGGFGLDFGAASRTRRG